MVNSTWDILEWLFIFFFWVETKGRTLEEIDFIFEGEKHSNVPDLGEVLEGKAIDDEIFMQTTEEEKKDVLTSVAPAMGV